VFPEVPKESRSQGRQGTVMHGCGDRDWGQPRIVRNCKLIFMQFEYVPCYPCLICASENHTFFHLVGVISWTVVLGNNDPGLVVQPPGPSSEALRSSSIFGFGGGAEKRGMNDEPGSSMKFLEFLASFGYRCYRKCEIW